MLLEAPCLLSRDLLRMKKKRTMKNSRLLLESGRQRLEVLFHFVDCVSRWRKKNLFSLSHVLTLNYTAWLSNDTEALMWSLFHDSRLCFVLLDSGLDCIQKLRLVSPAGSNGYTRPENNHFVHSWKQRNLCFQVFLDSLLAWARSFAISHGIWYCRNGTTMGRSTKICRLTQTSEWERGNVQSSFATLHLVLISGSTLVTMVLAKLWVKSFIKESCRPGHCFSFAWIHSTSQENRLNALKP